MKIYAKQVSPEYQESPLFLGAPAQMVTKTGFKSI